MRTHEQIIASPTSIAVALMPHLQSNRWADARAFANTVKAWKRNKSIPGEYWPAMERAGLATVRELADSAEARGLKRPEPQRTAAA